MGRKEFIEHLDDSQYGYEIIDDIIIIKYKFYHHTNIGSYSVNNISDFKITEIPDNVTFKNGGTIILPNLKKIGKNVKFLNGPNPNASFRYGISLGNALEYYDVFHVLNLFQAKMVRIPNNKYVVKKGKLYINVDYKNK